MDNDPIPKPIREQLHSAVDAFSAPLSRYAYSICGCVHRSKDAVQDTFLRLASRKDPIRPDEKLPPWLFRVCRTRLVDMFRKEGRMTTTAELPETNPEMPAPAIPSDVAESGDVTAAVYAYINELPGNQREVIRLKFQGQLSYREIADVTDLSVSNVGYLLHTALTTLRQKITTNL